MEMRRPKRGVLGATIPFLTAALTIAIVPVATSIPTHGEPTVIEAELTSPTRPDLDGWTRVRSEGGILIWRTLENSAHAPAVRGETDIDAPLQVAASFVFDLDRAPEWIAGLADIATQTTGDTEGILYGHLRSSASRMRAFTLTATLTAQSTPRALVAELRPALGSWGPDAVEGGREPSSVSFRLSASSGGRRTHVSVEIHCDVQIADDPWCVQQFQPDWVFSSLSTLRKGVPTTRRPLAPGVLALLEKPPRLAGTRTGPSYESVLADHRETIAIGTPASVPDLTRTQLGAPLASGVFVNECGAPDDMKIEVRVAVCMGRAMGVTVATEPANPAIASCIDRAVRGLRWLSSPKTDFLITTY